MYLCKRTVASVCFVVTAMFWGAASAQGQTGPNPAVDYTKPNFTNSPIIRKFVNSLPGLGVANKSNLGPYIPVAVPDTTTYPGCDYYVLGVTDSMVRMASDLPSTGTKVRGYYQINTTDTNISWPRYLGPAIVAQRNRPVRVKFVNKLGTGAAGDLFLPVDTTIMGAGMGPDGMTKYTQNRSAIHLHGLFGPWISDGTPHQWTVPAGEVTPYKKGVSARDVPDMPASGDGSLTYYWPNQQSARLMFYHDHSYGMTRLNVYAGQAAPYILRDPVELAMINGGTVGGVTYAAGTIPADEVPLIIQDKTFVPDPAALAATDPLWDTAKWGGKGSLWFPHVYMPNQDPNSPTGMSSMGRWDYGPYFWPVFAATKPLPTISIVPEAFMDTALVNGVAYPYLDVQPKAYRFRILNASNDRFWNLQLYYADPAVPNGTEVKMVPAAPNAAYPASWPTDNRAGGVPDPATAGPSIIQIGSEGGILPAPAVIPSQPVNYDYDRRSVTVLNVTDHALLLGPAERADVIVDFSSVPPGSKLILYSDSPAPVPAADPRIDYYTGNPDYTANGGAPSTQAGMGPNTRTIMQFRVSGTPAAPFNLARLNTALPKAYVASQDPPIVPQTAYPAPWKAATDTYAKIFTGTLNTPNLTFTDVNGKVQTLPVQNKAIQELFDAQGRMNATLGVELPFTSALTQTTIPLGYIDPATETLPEGDTQIWKITHNGVDTHAIHWHLINVQIINRVGWDGAIRPPDANELGWKETVRMNPLEDIIVAVRAKKPTLPFNVTDSIRPLDPTSPIGSTMGFTGVDPLTGNPMTVTNVMTNFGWEYMWHCHLLGHEENDMMRPMVLRVLPPAAPTNLTAKGSIGSAALSVQLTWTDNSTNETGFVIQRSTTSSFASNLQTFAAAAGATTYTDTDPLLVGRTRYYYRVCATNAGTNSTWSNTVNLTTAVGPLPAAPFSLTLGTVTATTVVLNWTNGSANNTGFIIQRARSANFSGSASTTVGTPNVTTYTLTGLARNTTYWIRIQATNAAGESTWSNVVTFTTLP